MSINFFLEGVKKPQIKYIAVQNWVMNVISGYGKKAGHINFIFATDDYVLDVNKQYLNHDYYTDIITFDDCEGDKISGDIYISLDRVKENSEQYNTQDTELLRVIIHGILHLIGFKDKTDEDAKKMREAEDAALALSNVSNCKKTMKTTNLI